METEYSEDETNTERNLRRAGNGDLALREHATQVGNMTDGQWQDEPHLTPCLTDLLVDLMHLCRREAVDFGQLYHKASAHFWYEVADEFRDGEENED